jgi:hypothetical protein
MEKILNRMTAKEMEEFVQWDLANEVGWTVAHEAAMRGVLHANFKQWTLATEDGWTVAHEFLRNYELPDDFDDWDVASNTGWTVAHVGAEHGNLPDGFSQWDLADSKGWTVAHAAVDNGYLPVLGPANFRILDLCALDGRSVASVALQRGCLTAEQYTGWCIGDGFSSEEDVHEEATLL